MERSAWASGAALESGGEDGTQPRAFAAIAGTEGGLAFVEEDGGDGTIDAAAEGVGCKAGRQGRMVTEQAEKAQTQTLA